MVYVIALGILLVIIIGIAMAASGRRYSDMTEEEFEAEAKRGSAMGAAVGRLQKIINPTALDRVHREAGAADRGRSHQFWRSP